MRLKLLTIALLIAMAITTHATGFYAQLDGGVANLNYQNNSFTNNIAPNVNLAIPQSGSGNDSNYEVGAAAGYQFNQYVAAEFDYYNFGAQRGFNYTAEDWTDTPYNAGTINQSGTFATALAAKLIYPLNQFSVFIKPGVALVHTNFAGSTNNVDDAGGGLIVAQSDVSKSVNNIEPIISAGVQYNVYKSLYIDTSYTYIYGSQSTFSFATNSSNAAYLANANVHTPQINIVSAGIGYAF